MIQFDRSACQYLNVAGRREWLETNGIGGFASSTIAGLNTRRYHGLLVAATKPPVGRVVLLSKVEETLVVGGRRIDLACNFYPGAIHPQGYRYLRQFRLDPFPVFVYEVDGLELEKSLFLVQGENTVVVQYQLRGAAADCSLELRPLVAFRDYHATTRQNGALDATLRTKPGLVEFTPYRGLPSLFLAHNADQVQPAGYWYRNFEYPVERERGLDFQEDLFNPLTLVFDFRAEPAPALVASTGAYAADAAGQLRARELARRQPAVPSPSADPFAGALESAAGQFLVRRGAGSTVIAGYHWFGDWGRDTMIALPGLTLTTGRDDVACAILLEYAASANRGMLPNRFPDAGEPPEYNSVDAALWFFEAVRALAARSTALPERLYSVLADIAAWHERGTRYGIRMDADGLLLAGEPGVALTWMDALAGGRPVTPRHGKAVEIQALWYNALRTMEDLAGRFGDAPRRAHYGELAGRVRASFTPLFWNPAAGCLYDVVNGDQRDAAIRPNQIFAASLFHKLLEPEKARAVVAVVERHLLTPYGLRTLAPSDPQYRGRYEGDPFRRDSAYHQGTVWPWLLGPFLTAWLDAHGRTPETRAQAGRWLAELRRFIQDEGVGQLPEVFDGDAPHRPGGCVAQAWSVAEVLRSLVELLAPRTL
jgi:predicted glycogen debranching enzyme